MHPILKIVLGAAGGGTVGFLYYKFIGCRTGACPMAANPWISILVWAVIGGLMMAGLKK
ncbi:MAG: hypothetical protein RDU76_08315 [Candidatus Edwardsbacteria bacterium]|nr:hypothetical protein [Candidatus Edwardsbacteria bacterium]